MNAPLTLAEIARLYRPSTVAIARHVLRALRLDIRLAADLYALTIARQPR